MKRHTRKRKLPYKEGTWFAIPLKPKGFAVGRVTRCSSPPGVIIAYLFGPRRRTVPDLDNIVDLDPADALRVWQVGDFGFVKGKWLIIGDSEKWIREEWPTPAFVRRDEITRTAFRVIYSDDVADEVVDEERIKYPGKNLEEDGLYGSEAAEIELSDIL